MEIICDNCDEAFPEELMTEIDNGEYPEFLCGVCAIRNTSFSEVSPAGTQYCATLTAIEIGTKYHGTLAIKIKRKGGINAKT